MKAQHVGLFQGMSVSRSVLAMVACILSMILLCAASWGHEGHEHKVTKKPKEVAAQSAKGEPILVALVQQVEAAPEATPQFDIKADLVFHDEIFIEPMVLELVRRHKEEKKAYPSTPELINIYNQARATLTSAHGNFGVDLTGEADGSGKGDFYWHLQGAGSLVLRERDGKNVCDFVRTPPEMVGLNMHQTWLWRSEKGETFLSHANTDTARVFTNTRDGRRAHTLTAPTIYDTFGGSKAVNDWFQRDNQPLIATGVTVMKHKMFVFTGYSGLDFVLPAEVKHDSRLSIDWADYTFGGKGGADKPGLLGTGHSGTIREEGGQTYVDVADRAHFQRERYTLDGKHVATLQLPEGSMICNIFYDGDWAVASCLNGPDNTKGAPIYLFYKDKIVHTLIAREEFNLTNFTHIHGAAIRIVEQSPEKVVLALRAQAWNPGGIAGWKLTATKK